MEINIFVLIFNHQFSELDSHFTLSLSLSFFQLCDISRPKSEREREKLKLHFKSDQCVCACNSSSGASHFGLEEKFNAHIRHNTLNNWIQLNRNEMAIVSFQVKHRMLAVWIAFYEIAKQYQQHCERKYTHTKERRRKKWGEEICVRISGKCQVWHHKVKNECAFVIRSHLYLIFQVICMQDAIVNTFHIRINV